MFFPKFNQKLVDVYVVELKNLENNLKKKSFFSKTFFVEKCRALFAAGPPGPGGSGGSGGLSYATAGS